MNFIYFFLFFKSINPDSRSMVSVKERCLQADAWMSYCPTNATNMVQHVQHRETSSSERAVNQSLHSSKNWFKHRSVLFYPDTVPPIRVESYVHNVATVNIPPKMAASSV